MCLAITSIGSVKGPIRLHDISRYVLAHYGSNAHPPLRVGAHGVTHTPNGGSMRTPTDLSLWCDGSTDSLTRYHVLLNIPHPKVNKRKREHDNQSPD